LVEEVLLVVKRLKSSITIFLVSKTRMPRCRIADIGTCRTGPTILSARG